jgi:pyridoxamine 5'-phosphate oxidase
MELLDRPAEPWPLFDRWFALAQQSEQSNPEAMALATVDRSGIPQLRTVLMKQIDQRGLVFFTNSHSTKGQNIVDQPEVSALFYWRTLNRQIRVNGRAAPVDDQTSDAYFASRARISQVGAWASQQSEPMSGPEVLAEAVNQTEQRFADQTVPRPPHWWGYRIVPWRFEFWIQEHGRLHQRIEYTRELIEQNTWNTHWIFP